MVSEPLDDIAAMYAEPIRPLSIDQLKRIIECIRDCAMEAEIGHELSGFRVELLRRHGLTDSSDPAFGPVKYPDQGPKSEPEPL